ncbi:MAG TPA: class I SAM-dependent methyltransferase [Planctomycetota bacterium]|nr:class I SAM-dependent methyltransferase [Planctomycetota bacterium]
MQTNYANHDHAYQKFERDGTIGWDGSGQAYFDRQVLLVPVLEGPHAPKTGRLLELGCGAGNMTLWFAARGFTAHGVDIAPTAIAMAKRHAEECRLLATFTVGNVVELNDYSPAPFDFVLDGHVLHCIIGADRARFLNNAFRLTRPGGYFLIDTMCQPMHRPDQVPFYDPSSRCTIYNGAATRYWGTVAEIEAEARAAGFQVLGHRVNPDEINDNVLMECLRPA